MKDLPTLITDAGYWDSPESVAIYSAEPYLFHGERLAFASCYPDSCKGRRVLDLGCGAGRTTLLLDKMGADVVGVDISRNLIRSAQQRAPHIDFRVGNAESLDFDDTSFDTVLFSFNGLDCLYPKDRRLRSIREVWRVLRPDGRFIFSHHNLTAFFFGWFKGLRPRKLRFRAKHILNGNAFKSECYLRAMDSGGVMMYYAWPKQVIADVCETGFEIMHIYPNNLLLAVLQHNLKTNWFTELACPWPYHVYRKTLSQHR